MTPSRLQQAAAEPNQAASLYRSNDAYVATILARPLFAAGRTPVVASSNAAAAEAALPRLTAIVATPGLRRAVFATRGSARSLAVAEGDSVGPFRLVAIGTGMVELDGADGRRILRLEPDQAFRSMFTGPPPVVPLVDPVRREAETENDQ